MNLKTRFCTFLLSIALMIGLAVPCYSFSVNAALNKLKSHENVESRLVIKKFIKAMLLVAGSGTAVFLILMLYKRRNNSTRGVRQSLDISKNLNAPENVEEATKFFIEKF